MQGTPQCPTTMAATPSSWCRRRRRTSCCCVLPPSLLEGCRPVCHCRVAEPGMEKVPHVACCIDVAVPDAATAVVNTPCDRMHGPVQADLCMTAAAGFGCARLVHAEESGHPHACLQAPPRLLYRACMHACTALGTSWHDRHPLRHKYHLHAIFWRSGASCMPPWNNWAKCKIAIKSKLAALVFAAVSWEQGEVSAHRVAARQAGCRCAHCRTR